MKHTLRIGLSMRVTQAPTYPERRDALAQDWPRYLNRVFPAARWLYLPNMSEEITGYIERWELNAFILTGGENIGEAPERDRTESAILRHARERQIPVLGICRGLQLIYTHLGGKVTTEEEAFARRHRATTHTIVMGETQHTVNSYHENRLAEETLPAALEVVARCPADGSIEAVRGERLLGIMWHPERSREIPAWETTMIKEFFEKR